MDVKAKDENEPVRYLLGEMTEAEQARFEESFFQDVELSERISDVENDLIDEYVRRELSPPERERFESHFLVSERRREKLELARALLEAENAAVAPRVVSGREQLPWWKAIFGAPLAPRRALSFSLGAAAFLFLLGALWLFSEVRQLRNEVARLEADRETRDRQNEELREQASKQKQQRDELLGQKDELERRLAELPRQAGVSEPKSASALALMTFILSPVARGSEGPAKLVIPPGVRSVRLQLNLRPGDEYPTYQVTLQSPTGDRVRSWNSVKASNKGVRAIYVDVQVSSMNPGQYEAILSGSGKRQLETLGYYYFKLLKD